MSLLRTKSIEASIADSESSEFALKKNLSALDLTVFGIGVIIGAGIFTVTGRAAHEMAGPAIVISFLIGAICCGLAALCYAELSSTVPVSGSAYTFSYATMGELVAWIIGWDLLLELILAAGVVSQGWSAYFNILFGEWGLKLPENLQGQPGWFDHFDIAAFSLVAVLTALIAIGIKESLRVNMALVALKLGIVVFIIVMGIQYINTDNYTPFIPPAEKLPKADGLAQPLWEIITGMQPQAFGVMGVISGAALVFFAYIGFDVVATTAEETRDPKRDLPIGIIGSLVVCTILYISVCLVITGMVPYDKIDPKGALAAAFTGAGHPLYAQIISAGAVAGLATVVMTLMIGASRVMYAMSRDGLLPRGMARTSDKTGTPVRMTLVMGLLIAVASAVIPIGEFEEMVNIGTLSAFFLVCIAVPIMRKRRPDLERPFKVPGSPVLPWLAALVCLYLMLNLPVETWMRFTIWLAIGFVVFFTYGKWNSRVGLEHDGHSAGRLSQGTAPGSKVAITAVVALVMFALSAWTMTQVENIWLKAVLWMTCIAISAIPAWLFTKQARQRGALTNAYARAYWVTAGLFAVASLVYFVFAR